MLAALLTLALAGVANVNAARTPTSKVHHASLLAKKSSIFDIGVGAGMNTGDIFGGKAGGSGSVEVSLDSPLDLCANVHTNVFTDLNNFLGLSLPSAEAEGDVCLCVGLIPGLIQSNVHLQGAAQERGHDLISSALNLLINNQPNKQTCKYPAHSASVCHANDPCGFRCTDGFQLSSDKKSCLCPSNAHISGNRCVANAPTAKAAKKPTLFGRSSAEAARVCGSANKTICGSGRTGAANSFECVDTAADLYSCGGCTTPLAGLVAEGKDCSLIPNVENVSCRRSSCHVTQCAKGFKVSASHDSCVAV